MTSPLIETVDLTRFEFEVSCEFGGCNNPATVSCKGCSDRRHYLICTDHLHVVEERFLDNTGKQCTHCHRPWLDFALHYDVQGIA